MLRVEWRNTPFLVLSFSLLLGCSTELKDPPDGGSGSGGRVGASGGNGSGNGSGSGSGSGTGSTGQTGGDGGVGAGGGGEELTMLPARIRRLTNSEYNASVQALLGTDQSPADDFPPDSRQQGYTVNEAQRIDPVLARALDAAAVELVEELRPQLGTLAPCQDPASGGEGCAETFVEAFGRSAYRRPLDEEDKLALINLYRAGADGGTYQDGIELVIRGVLQSPGFLYVTEIGEGGRNLVTMTSHEIASALSYMVTGGPPDDVLLTAAETGSIDSPEGRETEVRRLFATDAGQARAVRVVREWLGIDRIESTAKDANIYPQFADLRDAIGQETEDFVKEVLKTSPGTVGEFLGADWSVVGPNLAAMYQVGGSGRVEMPERIGLLNQAAFLSVYAHAHETAPVLRGVATMRRVACVDIQLPTNLNVQIVPPVPDPSKTTRERFAIHAEDSACANCHRSIDPIGFSFEHLDGMGAYRDTEKEAQNKPIDSSGDILLGLDFDGPYADSNELATALAKSAAVQECFARQIFRSASGEGQNAKGYETSFLALWEQLPADERGALLDLLVTYASSSLFSQRVAP